MTGEAGWATVSPARAFWRGLMRRCARCGSGKLFEGWFEMADNCPRCNLHFERNPGAFIGGIGLNTCVTAIVLLVALVLSLIYFDGAWGLVPMVSVAVVVPLLFFGSSKALWVAFEYVVTPPEPWE